MYAFLGKTQGTKPESAAAPAAIAATSSSPPAKVPQAGPPPPSVVPPVVDPPPAAIALSDDAVREFVGKFLVALASGDARRVTPFYADRVDYFAMGPVGLDVILNDKQTYFRRWPQVTLRTEGDVSIEPPEGDNARRVQFAVDYRVASAARATSATGTTSTTLTIALIDGAMKIVDHKETVSATPH